MQIQVNYWALETLWVLYFWTLELFPPLSVFILSQANCVLAHALCFRSESGIISSRAQNKKVNNFPKWKTFNGSWVLLWLFPILSSCAVLCIPEFNVMQTRNGQHDDLSLKTHHDATRITRLPSTTNEEHGNNRSCQYSCLFMCMLF